MDKLSEMRAAANNVEYARNRACVEGLAGWEHRKIREAADYIESLETALQTIADYPVTEAGDYHTLQQHARATLSGSSSVKP